MSTCSIPKRKENPSIMKIIKMSLFVLLLLVFALLVGCSPATSQPQAPLGLTVIAPEQAEGTDQEEPVPYPGPEQQEEPYLPPRETQEASAYPGPVSTIATVEYVEEPFVVPTPGIDTGVVTGKLVLLGTEQPIIFQHIYLGEKIPLDPGDQYLIGLTEGVSPHAITTSEGLFAIGDVPPGNYIVIQWTPHNAAPFIDQDTGREFEIEVVAGKTFDLGVLEGNDLLK
jgi:hypothetical protein